MEVFKWGRMVYFGRLCDIQSPLLPYWQVKWHFSLTWHCKNVIALAIKAEENVPGRNLACCASRLLLSEWRCGSSHLGSYGHGRPYIRILRRAEQRVRRSPVPWQSHTTATIALHNLSLDFSFQEKDKPPHVFNRLLSHFLLLKPKSFPNMILSHGGAKRRCKCWGGLQKIFVFLVCVNHYLLLNVYTISAPNRKDHLLCPYHVPCTVPHASCAWSYLILPNEYYYL